MANVSASGSRHEPSAGRTDRTAFSILFYWRKFSTYPPALYASITFAHAKTNRTPSLNALCRSAFRLPQPELFATFACQHNLCGNGTLTVASAVTLLSPVGDVRVGYCTPRGSYIA